MKYLKYFENIIEPKLNDYVSCEEDHRESNINLKNYIANNIGKIFRYNTKTLQYLIEFDYVPDNLKGRFTKRGGKYLRWLAIDNIKEFDDSIEKLKLKIQRNKYNI